MRFLRLNETRPTASLVAVTGWVLGMTLAAATGRALSGAMPLLVLPLASLLPMLSMLIPALLAYIAVRAGRLPAMLCAAAGGVIAASMLGPYAAVAAAPVPAAVFAVYSFERKHPFWHSVGACAGILLLAGMAALAMVNALNGGDAVTALRGLLEPLAYGSRETDRSLLWLASMGFVRLPDSVLPGMQLGSAAVLDGPMREEVIKQFLFASESLLRQTLPSQILQGAIYGGLLCVVWPRRTAARYANETELAPLPPFHKWHIPARLFQPMVFTLLAAGLLMLLSGAQAMVNLVNVLWTGVRTVLALQGGALLMFLMRKSGVRSPFRTAIVIAMLYLFSFALLLLGFADQAFNPRALRIPPNDKRDEEDFR